MVQSDLGRDFIKGSAVTLETNGGWCWFQDQRAIVASSRIIVGSVAGAPEAISRRGDIGVASYDLASGAITRAKLAEGFEANDHASPAFLSLPDGRILASYTRHHKDDLMAWRITERPGDISKWGPERRLDLGARVTYSNLFLLPGESDRIYNFHRGLGFNPNAAISSNGGESFVYAGRLLNWPRPVGDPVFTGVDGGRPYVKYASNGIDAIHFVTTEDHPWAYDTGVYHGFLSGGKLHGSDGSALADFGAEGVSPKALTRLFAGDPDNVAWTVDLRLDPQERPYTVFSVQKDGRAHRGTIGPCAQDHRYHYGRWDGRGWNVFEIAFAGTNIGKIDDYTGLAALDPHDPDRMVISTNADPDSGAPLISRADGRRHHELFEGASTDGGRTWAWTPLTANSTVDNIRPIIPVWPGERRAILWLRGTYRTWTNYDLDVLCLIQRR